MENVCAVGPKGEPTDCLKPGAAPAVVEVAAEAPAMFSFGRGQGTTSIDTQLTTDNAELVIYDLTGRRVEKMEKGIYIVNGKKVLVK